jgi:ABC-type antimicrobial peptide transport system permease subunit
MTVMGHVKDRVNSYIYNRDSIEKRLNKALREVTLELNVGQETPISGNMDEYAVIEYMLNNVLITVIFFICLLSFILIFSLMQTDVEERKYEFAVLRTLGMKNNSLITLISVQTLIFAIPALIMAAGSVSILILLT